MIEEWIRLNPRHKRQEEKVKEKLEFWGETNFWGAAREVLGSGKTGGERKGSRRNKSEPLSVWKGGRERGSG